MNREKPERVLRGQMYFANLDPVIGSEQGGNRPVLIIQNNVGNSYSTTFIVAPITTQIKKMRQLTHIGIPPYFGLSQNSTRHEEGRSILACEARPLQSYPCRRKNADHAGQL